MDYFVIVHPDVCDDIRKLSVRRIWEDSYRKYRLVRPENELSCKEIMSEFSKDLYLSGEVSRLFGISFKS